MASIGWRTGISIDALLQQNCHAFEFAQAVNLLCLRGADTDKSNDEALTLDQIDKQLQFESYIGEDFSASEITAIEPIKSERKRLTLSSFGLFGQQGPLPQPYQKWVRDNIAKDDRALNDFLNLFDNRLIALLYLVLAKQQSSLEGAVPELSRQGRYQAAIIGLDPRQPQQQQALQPLAARSLLAFSGLKADRRPSQAQLQNILQAYLETSVFIGQFVGGWLPLATDQYTCLSTDYRFGSPRKYLGKGSVLGSKVWKQNLGLNLFIGPLCWSRLKPLLPGEKDHEQFKSLLLYLTEQRWRLDIHLLLQAQDVPHITLTSQTINASTLALSSWLNSDQTFFQPITDNVLSKLPQRLRQQLSRDTDQQVATPQQLTTPSLVKLTFSPEHFSELSHD